MSHFRHLPTTVIGLLLALLSACASRQVPDTWPEGSAASPQARQGKVGKVTHALDADPPLPGTSTKGWPGLSAAPSTPGHAHGAHHGH